VNHRKIYEAVTNIEHVVLGFITGIAGLKNTTMMTLLFAGYMIYQFAEAIGEKDYVSLKGDILEYMVGYVLFTLLHIFLL
jgi:hypothetical protein